MKKSNSEIVLRALQFGMEIKLPFCDTEYLISLDDNNNLFFKGTRQQKGLPDSDIFLNLDMSFSEFLEGCSKIPDNEIIKIVAALALNKNNKRKH